MARRRRLRKRGKDPHIPKFSKIARLIEDTTKEVARKVLIKFAFELWGELVDGIKYQEFESFHEYPLTSAYLERKQRKGLHEEVMMATGHYVNSIRVIKHSPYNFEVNVPEDGYAVDSDGNPTKLRLRRLGRIHEFGSSSAGIPARKHWRVILKSGRKQAPAVAKHIAEKSARQIRRVLERGQL